MVYGKDDVIKRRQIASRISAQWIVAEQNTNFYHWLYRQDVLEFSMKNIYQSCDLVRAVRWSNISELVKRLNRYYVNTSLWPYRDTRDN